MSENPRFVIIALLRSSLSVKNPDGTAAVIGVSTPFPEYELPTRFLNYDGLVTVGFPQEETTQLANVHYQEPQFSIEVWAKTEQLRANLLAGIKQVLKDAENNPGGGMRKIVKVNSTDDDKPGSPTLFHSKVSAKANYYEE